MTVKPQPQFVLPPSSHTSLGHLPAFVEHGGELACRHPADAINSRMYAFAVDADSDLLDRYCEVMYNRPSGGAAGSEVLLNFVDIPTMGSTDFLDRRLGVCAEREAAIWFPVIDVKRGQFAWAVPYMFVDSALALAGGREVYGFPKQLGTIEIPRSSTTPPSLSVRSVTLKTHAPDSVATDYPVITVDRPDDGGALPPLWGDPAGALDVIESAIVDAVGGTGHPVLEALFFGQMVEENIPMLLLKQFRDAHQQGAACYQAVLTVDMAVTTFRSGGLLPDDYTITFADLAGEPMSRELGVAHTCRPRIAFWLEFDFLVRLATILSEARVGHR
jgi:hypothetical protein